MVGLSTNVLDEEQVAAMVYQALKRWTQPATSEEREYWQPWLLVREATARQTEMRVAINKALEMQFTFNKSDEIAILQDRFLAGRTILQTAQERAYSPDQVSRLQRSAIQQVARGLILQEERRRGVYRQTLVARLRPSTAATLFGRDSELDQLAAILLAGDAPSALLVQGVGGIGKTSLVIEAAKRAIDGFMYDDVIWVNAVDVLAADENAAPALVGAVLSANFGVGVTELKDVFERMRVLVMLDGFGTEQPLDALLLTLLGYAGRSRFVLTTRRTSISALGRVQTLRLAALGQSDSEDLFRDTVVQQGADRYPDIDFPPLYELVGGNPLALRLVAGLLAIFPPDVVFAQLRKRDSDHIDAMYRSIYQVAWDALPEHAKTLLLQLATTSAAGVAQPLDAILAVSSLPERNVLKAIEALYVRSLIERMGADSYGLHALTRSFVRSLAE